MKRSILSVVIFLLSSFAVAAPVFNAKGENIEIIVPYAVGGGTSNHAHLVAEMFSDYGWPTVVINRPGGDAVIGANAAARAQPNGRTLMVAATSAMSANVAFGATGMEYNEHSFVPVSLLNQFGMVLAVPADSPIKNYEQFKFYVRANPEKFNLGFHNGPLSNIFYEWAREENLPRPNIVIYKGSAPMDTDLVGGHVPFIWDNYTAPLVPLIESGRVRVIATMDSVSLSAIQRIQPGIEVTDVSRQHPDLRFGVYYGLFAPAGTPPAVVAEMNRVINQSTKTRKFQKEIVTMGIKNIGGRPEVLGNLQQRDIQTLKKLPKEDR